MTPPQMSPLCAQLLHRRWLCVGAAAAVLLSACSAPVQRPHAAHTGPWSGRLALQVQSSTLSEQDAQSFSAAFELQGTPQAGQLQLLNPLGSVVAHLEWQPGAAKLRQGDATRTSDSLPALLEASLGAALPVEALFAWLQGEALSAPGWSVDLAQFPEGRITAQRHSPTPQARLRLILDR